MREEMDDLRTEVDAELRDLRAQLGYRSLSVDDEPFYGFGAEDDLW